MRKRVICISHATGAGGEEVGRLIAQQLRLHYVDDEIVMRAAGEGRVSPEALADAERRKPALAEIFRTLRHTPLEVDGTPPGRDDTESHRALIRAAIHAAADEGDTVIVSHAASYTLGPRPDVLRVLVTASPETRAARVAQAAGTSEREGRRRVRASDAGRTAYLKSFYDVRREQPIHYDLVVNTDTIAAEEAAALVAAAAGSS